MRRCLVHFYLLRRIGSNLDVMPLRGAPSYSYVIKFYPKQPFLCKWTLLCRSMPDKNVMRMILIYTINRQQHMFNSFTWYRRGHSIGVRKYSFKNLNLIYIHIYWNISRFIFLEFAKIFPPYFSTKWLPEYDLTFVYKLNLCYPMCVKEEEQFLVRIHKRFTCNYLSRAHFRLLQ